MKTTLGDLIAFLEERVENEKWRLVPGVSEPHSWRGVYAELSFEPVAEGQPVKEALAVAKSAVGETYAGWKGGEFTMGADTPVNVDIEGRYTPQNGLCFDVSVDERVYIMQRAVDIE